MDSEVHESILKINKEYNLNTNVVMEDDDKGDSIYYYDLGFIDVKLYIYHKLYNTSYNDIRTRSFLDGFYWGVKVGKRLERKAEGKEIT